MVKEQRDLRHAAATLNRFTLQMIQKWLGASLLSMSIFIYFQGKRKYCHNPVLAARYTTCYPWWKGTERRITTTRKNPLGSFRTLGVRQCSRFHVGMEVLCCHYLLRLTSHQCCQIQGRPERIRWIHHQDIERDVSKIFWKPQISPLWTALVASVGRM